VPGKFGIVRSMLGLRFAELALATFLTLVVASLATEQIHTPPTGFLLPRFGTQKELLAQNTCPAVVCPVATHLEMCPGFIVDTTWSEPVAPCQPCLPNITIKPCGGGSSGGSGGSSGSEGIDCIPLPENPEIAQKHFSTDLRPSLPLAMVNEPTGACCSIEDYRCLGEDMTSEACAEKPGGGGFFFGGNTCAEMGCGASSRGPCPESSTFCCDATEITCFYDQTCAETCTTTGACNVVPPTGACCSAVDYSCVGNAMTSEACAVTPGGAYFFGGNTCAEMGCGATSSSSTPTELCCFGDGSMCFDLPQGTCSEQTGNPWIISNCTACTPPVSCCFSDGGCFDDMMEGICEDLSGTPLAENHLCSIINCGGTSSSSAPSGACCRMNGTCNDVPEAECSGTWDEWDGQYQCSQKQDCSPMGICCLPDRCAQMRKLDCDLADGEWSQCDPALPDACTEEALCPIVCNENYGCCRTQICDWVDPNAAPNATAVCTHETPSLCSTRNDDAPREGCYQLPGVSKPYYAYCTGDCPDPEYGACCTSNGTCSITRRALCKVENFETWKGGDCTEGICPSTGACCTFNPLACTSKTFGACSSAGGEWKGNGIACPANASELCGTYSACCFGNTPEMCSPKMTPTECTEAKGRPATQCDDCVFLGACCRAGGGGSSSVAANTCELTTSGDCTGNDHWTQGKDCEEVTCEQGACCRTQGPKRGMCENVRSDQCGAPDVWKGTSGAQCVVNSCPIACCYLPTSTCTAAASADECTGWGANYKPAEELTCGPSACKGACCLADPPPGAFCAEVAYGECDDPTEGTWMGGQCGDDFGAELCTGETGACCTFNEGTDTYVTCTVNLKKTCNVIGVGNHYDTIWWKGESCEEANCQEKGACCEGEMCSDKSRILCPATGWKGGTCEPNTCKEEEKGACCDGTTCKPDTPRSQCLAPDWKGGACEADTCKEQKTCCAPSGICTPRLGSCDAGETPNEAASCTPNPCPQPATVICCSATKKCEERKGSCQAGETKKEGATKCEADTCKEEEKGACCSGTQCLDDTPKTSCPAPNWKGGTCAADTCAEVVCCYSDTNAENRKDPKNQTHCLLFTPEECQDPLRGGIPHPELSSCFPDNPCTTDTEIACCTTEPDKCKYIDSVLCTKPYTPAKTTLCGSPDPCVKLGHCCIGGTICSPLLVTEDQCKTMTARNGSSRFAFWRFFADLFATSNSWNENGCPCADCSSGDECNYVPSDLDEQCVSRSCDIVTRQCMYTPVDNDPPTSCDDDDLCTENDTCADGACTGTTMDCGDDDPCTEDWCFEGACLHDPVGGGCDSSSSSSSSEEKGNCCVEDDTFGFCFTQIPRSLCEDDLVGGIYFDRYPCIEFPMTGSNCGLAGADSSSSEGESSSGGSSSNTDCGNTIIQTELDEQCDEGDGNSDVPNATCRTNCHPARCGDNIVDDNPPGREKELCDDGALNSDSETARCRANCKFRNAFFTIGEWLGDLELYSINGTPVPDAPAIAPDTSLFTIGLLVLLLF